MHRGFIEQIDGNVQTAIIATFTVTIVMILSTLLYTKEHVYDKSFCFLHILEIRSLYFSSSC